jgi:transcriptional regulator with XRE-family HTH domain
MPEATTGSTVPRRQLGRYLRELRNQNRLTIKVAAEKLEWSEVKMWRIETGHASLRSHDVQTMCRIYGAQPARWPREVGVPPAATRAAPLAPCSRPCFPPHRTGNQGQHGLDAPFSPQQVCSAYLP